MYYDYEKEVKDDVYDYMKDLRIEDQLKIVFGDIDVEDLCDEIRYETDITEGKIYTSEAEQCLLGNRDLLVEAIEVLSLDRDPKFLMDLIKNPTLEDGYIRDNVLEHSVDCAKADLMYEYYQEYNQEQLKVLKEMIDKDVYYDFLVNPDLKADDMSRLYKSIANGDKSMEEVSNETFRILDEAQKEDDLDM